MKNYFMVVLLFFSFQIQAMMLFECNMSSEGAISAVKRWIFDSRRDKVIPSYIVRKNKDQERKMIFPEFLSPKVVSIARTGEGHYSVVVRGARGQVAVGVNRCGGIY